MVVEQIANNFNVTGPEALVALGLGYTVLILHISRYKKFWKKLGGAERGFIAIIIGLSSVLLARVINLAFDSLAHKILINHSSLSHTLWLTSLIFAGWGVAAVNAYYNIQEENLDLNPIGLLLILASIYFGVIVLILTYLPDLIWSSLISYTASYNAHGIISNISHYMLLLLISYGVYKLGVYLALNPSKSEKVGILAVIKSWAKHYDIRTRNKILLLVTVLSLSLVYLLIGMPIVTHHDWVKEQATVQIEVPWDDQTRYVRADIRENRTIDIRKLGKSNWIGMRYGEDVEDWDLRFKNGGRVDEVEGVEVDDFEEFSTIRLNYTERELLRNRTVVLERERRISQDKFNISSFHLKQTGNLCHLNFTVSSTIQAPRLYSPSIEINHRNFSQLGDYNLSTFSVYDAEGSSLELLGEQQCQPNSECELNTGSGNGYEFILGESRAAHEYGAEILIQKIDIDNSEFKYLFDITAACS